MRSEKAVWVGGGGVSFSFNNSMSSREVTME